MGMQKLSGEYYAFLKHDADLGNIEERKVIISDLKLFAQIKNREIDAFTTKERKALPKMINPLKEIKV